MELIAAHPRAFVALAAAALLIFGHLNGQVGRFAIHHAFAALWTAIALLAPACWVIGLWLASLAGVGLGLAKEFLLPDLLDRIARRRVAVAVAVRTRTAFVQESAPQPRRAAARALALSSRPVVLAIAAPSAVYRGELRSPLPPLVEERPAYVPIRSADNWLD